MAAARDGGLGVLYRGGPHPGRAPQRGHRPPPCAPLREPQATSSARTSSSHFPGSSCACPRRPACSATATATSSCRSPNAAASATTGTACGRGWAAGRPTLRLPRRSRARRAALRRRAQRPDPASGYGARSEPAISPRRRPCRQPRGVSRCGAGRRAPRSLSTPSSRADGDEQSRWRPPGSAPPTRWPRVTRTVTEQDTRELAETTPGLGLRRAHVRPGFHPPSPATGAGRPGRDDRPARRPRLRAPRLDHGAAARHRRTQHHPQTPRAGAAARAGDLRPGARLPVRDGRRRGHRNGAGRRHEPAHRRRPAALPSIRSSAARSETAGPFAAPCGRRRSRGSCRRRSDRGNRDEALRGARRRPRRRTARTSRSGRASSSGSVTRRSRGSRRWPAGGGLR